jgi:hypothetical protein
VHERLGPSFGQPDVVGGIYRIEEDGSASAIADIGAWSIAHPPATDFFVDSGVHYALEELDGDLLVTDGHHNRVLRVTRGGDISQMIAFGNIVPTGLEVRGETVYMGEAGPIPHLPQNGKVVRFTPTSAATDVAAGASLIVDVRVRPVQQALRPLAGRLGSPGHPRERGRPGIAGHRTAPAGHGRRQLRSRRRWPGPADIPRVRR